MINIPKGTKDMLPQEAYKWHYVEDVAREVAACFGFKEIRTPMFEHTELFLRGVGETTDIVTKEMYTFDDKGGRSMTLRPEGTAGVARCYIENGLHQGVLPMKAYYIASIFRYEKTLFPFRLTATALLCPRSVQRLPSQQNHALSYVQNDVRLHPICFDDDVCPAYIKGDILRHGRNSPHHR